MAKKKDEAVGSILINERISGEYCPEVNIERK